MDWRRLISSREALLFNERRLLFVFQPSNCHACYGRSGRIPANNPASM